MADPLWTGEEIGAILDMSPLLGESLKVTGVSIDSRTLQRGDLFVAIKGERTDGHEYVEAAARNGAAGAIVSSNYPAPASALSLPLLRVPDPLAALNMFGTAARARMEGPVIAVTGSVGKTGTKEMLRAALSPLGNTHASEKSYNNLWGVPLSLARMPRPARFGIFEIGMNHAGEITPLTKMVRPHIAIVTWVAPVHIEFFNSVAEIADAKAEIFEGLEPDGYAVLPLDNEHYDRLALRARCLGRKIVSFGQDKEADAKLLSVTAGDDGLSAEADILGQRLVFQIRAHGVHLAANAIAALAAVKLAGGDVLAAAENLAGFDVPEGRGRRFSFDTPTGPVLLIDETYNANPASMAAAIASLGALSKSRYARRVAVLGDMLELGHGGPQFHAGIKSAIDSNAIDLVFCAGSLMANLYERLPTEQRGGYADSAELLKRQLLDTIEGGDAVMIKGSLGSRMGPLADALKSQFTAATENKAGRNAA